MANTLLHHTGSTVDLLFEGKTILGGPFPLKVMAIKDGYVMARFDKCIPFVEKESEFRCRMKLLSTSK